MAVKMKEGISLFGRLAPIFSEAPSQASSKYFYFHIIHWLNLRGSLLSIHVLFFLEFPKDHDIGLGCYWLLLMMLMISLIMIHFRTSGLLTLSPHFTAIIFPEAFYFSSGSAKTVHGRDNVNSS
jgi:hypothetical protein